MQLIDNVPAKNVREILEALILEILVALWCISILFSSTRMAFSVYLSVASRHNINI